MAFERNLRPQIVTAAAVVLLLLMAVLAGGAARHESVTIDEVAHVGAGVSYLQKLDMRLNVEHPPLAKVIAAVPLVVRGIHADYSQVSWSFSAGFFKQYLGQWVFGHWLITRWNDPDSTMLWARIPMLMVTLALGVVVYFYGARLGNPTGGLLCLAVYATMPAFLAFGALVLTDTLVTLCVLLTLWSLADLWRSPTNANALKLGVALGAALLSKFSAGLLFFCFPAFALSLRLRPLQGQLQENEELRIWRRGRWKSLSKAILLAAVVVYLTYLALSWKQPSDSLSVIPHFPSSPVLRRLLMPAWIYLQGLVTFAFTSNRPTFILGHSYPHGVWFYFPVLFFLKSPLAFIGLLLVACAVGLTKRRVKTELAVPQGMQFHWRAVWVFLVVFTASCLLSRLTISIRHFSVPLVLLTLLLARLPGSLDALQRSGWRAARPAAWLTLGLTLISVVTPIRAYPHFFPFLNSLSMGRPGYELVNDSNLDWNQALPEVEQWVRRRGLTQVLVDEYGFSEPSVYIPQARFWNCQEPSDSDGGQWAVVSAGMIADGHNCLWLLQYPGEVLAAGGMYAFKLPPVIPEAGSVAGPPVPAARHNFGGSPLPGDFRLVILNCIRDPQQLQPTLDRMQAIYQAMAKSKK